MADPRLDAALSRIERVLARLEARPRDGGLERRHEALRAATADALAGLDRLLERAR